MGNSIGLTDLTEPLREQAEMLRVARRLARQAGEPGEAPGV